MIYRFLLVFIYYWIMSNVESARYPNEIVDTPIVICDVDQVTVKIKTTISNPSRIYVDGHENEPECSSKNQNRIEISHGKCGMINDSAEQPTGSVKRFCFTVQLHPLFVTEADRSYCAQCVYMDSHVMKDIESSLDISDAPPTILSPQFDQVAMPRCSYTIRKDSKDGPPVQYASIGDTVYHVWSCDGDHNGILVQNCHVDDGNGNKILIIDQNGCGIDDYVMATPLYSSNQYTAFQETHVFKFAQRTVTRFICQIRICLKGDDCKKLSPPTACPSLEDRLTSKTRDEKTLKLSDIPHPPGLSPLDQGNSDDNSAEFIRRSPTKGTIYYGVGYNAQRNRREVIINDKDRKPNSRHFTVKNGFPEVEMVGELRVLETPEDVHYFENKANEIAAECYSASSDLLFTLLITAIIVLSILLISLFLLLSSRIKSRKHNSMNFAQ